MIAQLDPSELGLALAVSQGAQLTECISDPIDENLEVKVIDCTFFDKKSPNMEESYVHYIKPNSMERYGILNSKGGVMITNITKKLFEDKETEE